MQFEPPTDIAFDVSLDRLLMAARMLFNDSKLKSSEVYPYTDLPKNQPLTSIQVAPGTTSVILKTLSTSEQDSWWSFTMLTTIMMSVLIFAFAHVPQLEECSDLPLYEDPSVPVTSTVQV